MALPPWTVLQRYAAISGVSDLTARNLHGAGFTGYSAYAPTKYAVRGLADTLRNEVTLLTSHVQALNSIFGSLLYIPCLSIVQPLSVTSQACSNTQIMTVDRLCCSCKALG